MKELSIEQKAKAYDEAFKEASVAHKDEDRHLKATLERIFPELKESEDERTRKELLSVVNDLVLPDEQQSRFVAWLEKQGEHADFRNKIQIGDKVTRNEDGVLVNLSQLNRVAKKLGEQKPQRMISAEAKETLYGKTAWSEEDKNVLEDIEEAIINYWHGDTQDILLDWLKSLRPQSHWKPIDEQMEAVKSAALDVAKFSSRSEQLRLENEPYYKALVSLYNDLKKLREE